MISTSGYAFVTRDALLLVRTEQKATQIDRFSPFLEDLTVPLIQLLVDRPRRQVTHFV